MSRQARDPVSGSWMPIAGYPEIDAVLDVESTNPIQNKAVANPIEAIVNVYGSKNLLPNNATSQVINGITFTVNSDGSVTANGTASAFTFFKLATIVDMNSRLDSGVQIICSGCPEGGLSNTYNITVGESGVDTGDGCLMTTPLTGVNIGIIIKNGVQINNLTFYPMIRDARITDPTYVPYAMTNRELTERVKDTIIYKNYTFENVAITSQSSSGMYYTSTYFDISVTGYHPIGATICNWNYASANFVPYFNQNNSEIGFMSDISQTVRDISVRIIYKKI